QPTEGAQKADPSADASVGRMASRPIELNETGPVRAPSTNGATQPRQQQPLRAELQMNQQSTETRQSRMADTPKRELTPEQTRVTQVIDYVRTLIELGDKPVWSLASY